MALPAIGIRELRENLSRAIRRVRAGETIEVTDRGRAVARIVPVVTPEPSLEQLVAEGTLLAPSTSSPLPPPLDLPSHMTSEEAIEHLRGR